MQNAKLLLITLIGTLVLVFGATWVFSQFSGPAPSASQNLTVSEEELLSDSPHVMGAENPTHTIVSFSDFLCPACAGTAPQIEALVRQYPDQVRYVYRHYPLLNLHPQAIVLAQVSEAAANQDKFWQMHDELYANQEALSGKTRTQTLDEVWKIAANIEGLNVEQLQEDWEQEKYASQVQEDLTQARQLNLSFTPSVFLDGQLMPIDQVKAEVQSSLQ